LDWPDIKEILPALSQVSKEGPFVLQEQVVAAIKSVAFSQAEV